MIDIVFFTGLVKEYGPWALGWVFFVIQYFTYIRAQKRYEKQIDRITDNSTNAIINNTTVITKLTTIIETMRHST